MALSRGQPMPHDPGCPGHSHRRARDKACEAYRLECNERKQRCELAHTGDCVFCTRTSVPVHFHDGQAACLRCYNRWQARGFTGNGPGPERPSARERAIEHWETILGTSAAKAAGRLGVSARTVVRWRALLPEELPCRTA